MLCRPPGGLRQADSRKDGRKGRKDARSTRFDSGRPTRGPKTDDTMKLIEIYRHLPSCTEFRLYELTPEELRYQNDRDRQACRWGIIRNTIRNFFKQE